MNHDSLVAQIKHKADLVQIVGRYVHLRQKGHDFMGLCPFHDEKTPSFYVRPKEGYFKCFGCQAKGDVIAFMQQKTGLLFKEVVEQLAEELGITHKNPKKSLKNTSLEQALQQIKDYFHTLLLEDPKAAYARNYFLQKRKLPSKWIKEYEIGFAGVSDSDLMQFLRKSNIALPQAKELGILKEGESGLYGFFQGRLMLPIRDHQGHLVGFGARLIEEDSQKPKYLNSPTGTVFKKTHLLYGLHAILPQLKEGKPAVLVEGYFDVMVMQSLGHAAMATLGTNLSKEHLNLLKSYTRQLILAFDQDEAGNRAREKALFEALKLGFDVKQISWSEKDPAAFLETKQLEALQTQANEPKDALQSLILNHSHTQTIDERIKALRYLMRFVSACPDELAFRQYVRFISQVFLEDEQVLLKYANRTFEIQTQASPSPTLKGWQKLILGAILKNPLSVLEIDSILYKIEDDLFKSILTELCVDYDAKWAQLRSEFPSLIASLEEIAHSLSQEEAKKMIEDWLNQVALQAERKGLSANYQDLIKAQNAGDWEGVRKALSAHSKKIQTLLRLGKTEFKNPT